MKKRKVLIISGNGQVGYSLLARFSRADDFVASGTCHTISDDNLIKLDITDYAEFKEAVLSIKPDILLLNAALTNVEYCEEHPDESYVLNVRSVEYAVEFSAKNGIKPVFFSTEYIFDGENGPYGEDAAANPLNVYGRDKLAAEKLVESLRDYLIIRTTVIYGHDPKRKNFLLRMIDNIEKGNVVYAPIDQVTTPTYSANLSDALLELLRKDCLGIYNVAGSERLNRYEFALNGAEIFGVDKSAIIPKKTNGLNQKAKRPLSAGLLVDKLKRDTGFDMMSSVEGLKNFHKEYTGRKR